MKLFNDLYFFSVKCLEKKVKDAYYIVCQDCCVTHQICSKCAKNCNELELVIYNNHIIYSFIKFDFLRFGESEIEARLKEDQFQQELKLLSERQRSRQILN